MKRTELRLLVLSVLAGIALGSLFAQTTSMSTAAALWAGIATAAFAYSLSCIVRLRIVVNWLQRGTGEPPQSYGEWGELLDELHRSRNRQLHRVNELQARIQHFQDSFASLEDAVVLLNELNEIDWFNSSAVRLLGLREEEDLGQPLMNLVRDPDFVQYFDDAEFIKPMMMSSPQSESVQLEVHITDFGEGNRILFLRDVTDVRRLEQIRTDFAANVSHELRTPLTVIRGYLESFLESDTRWQPALEQMQTQAQRMESLVEDLMQLHLLESVADDKPPIELDMGRLVRNVFDQVSILRPEQRLELREKTGARLLGDYEELYSAVSNLVNNASKYSPPDGKITVSWQLDASGASLKVQDNGVGIEAQHIDRLTERFYRVDESRQQKTGGTGLGLAIVKHVLLRHHSALSIDSVPGQGSTFTCHFPDHLIVQST